ncbi:MAG: His-Xaa-Ser system protein HxsD [Muribaculaceae bacterium]|nr:His-Xaa-Ser system protein HxsD [Muribaculaceae bacterium]
MEVNVDRRIYNDSVISKVIYWLSKDYVISRSLIDENIEKIFILIKNNLREEEENLNEKFHNLLNDFKLRDIIAQETRDIKTILYAKAFADDENLSENDITD